MPKPVSRYKRRKDRRVFRVTDEDGERVTLVGRHGGPARSVSRVALERDFVHVALCAECGGHHPAGRHEHTQERQFSASSRRAPY
jgi:hypothetical protein